MIRFFGFINKLNLFIGHLVSWLTLGMVLLTFIIVILRYMLNLGWVWLQELVLYMHAITFLCACASTLVEEGHVRVDIFYANASTKTKALANAFGSAFLLIPTCALLFYHSLPYVSASWEVWEGSKDSGGLHAVFLLKSFILVFCLLTFLQGLSLLGTSLLFVLRKSS